MSMNSIERAVAKSLLDIGSVLLSPEKPFTWASGWLSPVYCDNRKILSHPALREQVCRWMAENIAGRYPEFDTVAGVATGAIAHGALIAHFLGKPFIYVRPKAKDHGTGSKIEGVLNPGDKVVVVEDLISTGMSSLAAVASLQSAGADVLGMSAIFSYNFNKARKAFEDANVELNTLTNFETLIEVACETGYVREEDMEYIRKWRLSPAAWGREEQE